jgi:LPXTG-motif cell wall-anchored protein
MRDTDNQFDWTTTPTPNAANQLTAPEDDDDGDDTDPPDTPTPTPTPTPSATPATRSTTTETTNTFKSITITEARAAAKSTKVKVTGIVTAEPDMLSGKFFYIQDDQSGIQIYSGKSNFPELKLGQEIEVSGTVSEAQGEKKINTGDDAIKVLRNKDVPDPQEIATGKVEEEQEGMLVKINGALSRQSGKTFYLDDGSGEAKISILSTSPLNKPDMKKGDAVTIVGIIGQTTSGYRVMPRIAEDLITGQVAGAETASEVGTIHQLPDAGPNANFILIIAGVFMASGIALWLIWRPKSKPINSRLSA